jgi:hypothetical protein
VYEQPAWIGTTNSTAVAAATTRQSIQTPFGKWIGLFYNPGHRTSDELAFSNHASGWYNTDEKAHTAFVMSPFHLGGYPDQAGASFPIEGIPPCLHNGPAQGKRIGSDVNAVSDHWSFKITVPPFYNPLKTDTTSVPGYNWVKPDTSKDFTNLRTSQRPIKIRLIGVMQHTLDRAGDIGFRPSELFKDLDRIDTHFQTDNAQGYRVVYDKTKSMALTPHNNHSTSDGTPAASALDSANGSVISDTGVSMRQFECNFGWRGRYVLSYADTTNSGLQCPETFPNDNETVAAQIGVTKNMITWYVFVEDRFSYVKIAADGTSREDIYPLSGLKMLVTRKFKYTDN